jgi:hypothetical protein
MTPWASAAAQTLDGRSSHSRDQLELFANHELRPVYFTERDIQAHEERIYHPGMPALERVPSAPVR